MVAASKKSAFTIVEILVTISVIALLLGLLLPALSAVQRQSRKRTEANNLKQVHLAWMMYANHNNDATVPGYLDVDVQGKWQCRYEYPDGTVIPVFAFNCSCPPPRNITGPWTWRLFKYLDYSASMVEFYEGSALATGLQDIDNQWLMQHVIEGPNNSACESYGRSHAVAESPIFGYNGFYVGGFWTMQGGMPRYEYFDHCESNNPDVNYRPGVAIARTVGQIRRTSELITFCAAARVDAIGTNDKFIEERPGTYLVTPPNMSTPQWRLPQQISDQVFAAGDIEVLNLGVPNSETGNHAGVPFARYGGGAAVLHADGNIDQQNYRALLDMRKWIDNATRSDYQHAACQPAP